MTFPHQLFLTSMKHSLYIFPILLLSLCFLPACEDNLDEDEDDSEFTENWKERNAEYFLLCLDSAKTAIAEAQATYGDDWEDHCQWRAYRSWAKAETAPLTGTDSICVKIVDVGEGTVTPLYTDSIRVNYKGYLIPTESYPEGLVFDHSGLYESDDYVFNPDFAIPSEFSVSNLVEGYTTAVMYMHVGDRWKIYIPQELAYQESSSGYVKPYSTLIFDVQLKGIYRSGVVLPDWE